MKKLLALLLAAAMLLCVIGAAGAEAPAQDRAGNAITVPEKITKVISLAPSVTQVLEALGMTDLLVAVDNQSPLYVEGLDELPQFDMMAPDIEAMAALEADVVIASGLSWLDGDPFAPLTAMGVCVIDIPSSYSIAGVEEDVQFIADVMGKSEEGAAIVAEMQEKIDAIAAIGETITEKKTVMFEISAAPWIYSFGQGTFLDEMITIIGAVNVFGEQTGWIAVSEEDALAANPDVILTSVNYLDDAVAEILGREGWDVVTAVASGNVFYIDNGYSNLPNQNIVLALAQMAQAVYPELYK